MAGKVEARWAETGADGGLHEGFLIAESSLTIYLNGSELVTLMCSPLEQDALAIGFLHNEDLVRSMEDVTDLHVSDDGCCAEVWLSHPKKVPERRILTSGCAGGVTFEDMAAELPSIESELTIDAEELFEWFEMLQPPDGLYASARGVHGAGMARTGEIVARAEDIGRHNAVDKVAGKCLLAGIDTEDGVLMATGRISSEMLRKGARMECPIVASRTSPTSLSVQMAEALGITLIGYARRGRMRAYTHPQRLMVDGEPLTSLPGEGN